MNIVKLVLDFVLARRGSLLAAWATLCIGTIVVYRLYDVRLAREEIAGMTVFYGAIVAAASAVFTWIKRRRSSTP